MEVSVQARQVGTSRWIVALEKGEEIISVLTSFLEEQEIRGGFLTGLGSLRDITLGYFDFEKKEYEKRVFDEVMELGNLTGSIGTVEGKPFAHLHATVCGPELIAFTGHLFSAEVAVTAELVVADFGVELPREPDEEIGLHLFSLEEKDEPEEEEEPEG